MWDLVSAINFIRELQPIAYSAGYNVTLGGGVLNRGFSNYDLDIVIIPRGDDISKQYLPIHEFMLSKGFGEVLDKWKISNPSRIVTRLINEDGRVIDEVLLC